jgi:RHS repeat-associated protein
VCNRNEALSFYTHDGNKNVSEVLASDGETIVHYEYAPFGALIFSVGDCEFDNPWRFSSEYPDDGVAMVYYNYRHYEPVVGRWISRDPVDSLFSYSYVRNSISGYDYLGYKGLVPEISSEEKKKILEDFVASIKKLKSEGKDEAAARVAVLMYIAMCIGGAKDEPLASEFMMLWLSGSMKNKTYTMKADDVMKIVTDDKKGPNDEPSVRDALKRDLCPLMKGKGLKKGRLEEAPSSPYIYTDPYFHAIGGFELKVSADFSSTDCCVYKVVGDWKFKDEYNWHAGHTAEVMGVDIEDDWALLVEKYRKELAAWISDPKLDLAHSFVEEGTWNGEVTIDCCDNGKGGNK